MTGENTKVGLAEVASSVDGFERKVSASSAVAGASADKPVGDAPAATVRDPFAIEQTDSARARRALGEGTTRGGGKPTDAPVEPLADLAVGHESSTPMAPRILRR